MTEQRIARVVADPTIASNAADPSGWTEFAYWRLNGSPRVYRSSYEADVIAAYAQTRKRTAKDAWCIFDNTAGSEATANAIELSAMFEDIETTPSIMRNED